ncbi:MAG: hypothetical protein IPM29_19955 [Planctomycetes bacterium]|nr:hypothetical protein [Planctomycetota bacterium]
MGFINLAEKTINAKLVYYGCGMGGKTTSLQVVHEIMCPRNEVQLVSIKTEEDATLLFDFLPIDLGEVEGFKVRIQGFTVPGQPKYRRMRKYVLSGADAVVLVIDSQRSRLEENRQSLESLRENLRSNGLDPDSIPIVLQYNKRDLEDVIPEPELDAEFRSRDSMRAYPSVATEGHGVFETFVHAAGELVEAKVRLYGLGRGRFDPKVVAEGARKKLWEIYDESAYARAHGGRGNGAERLELTFDDEGRSLDEGAAGARGGDDVDLSAVFTDDDLAGAFGMSPQVPPIASHPMPQGASIDDDEPLPALLDATVSSNLELARRFGELDRYKTLLERKNRQLVETTQNVVHDLNRPLSAIRLMLSSMRKGFTGQLPAQATKAIDHGLTAAAQMERLIRDLLDSSRLDFDGMRLDFQDIDLSELVAKVLESLRYEMEEAAVEVEVGELPRVRVDEWAMTRVLTNLVSNAVQYRSPDRQLRIEISAESDGERHLLRVADNGIGIPERDHTRLFQRFERGTNTKGISGTGLGLHIVREVLLGHGGDAWFESEEGVGTTFLLHLPRVPVQAPHDPVSEVADGGTAHRRAWPQDPGSPGRHDSQTADAGPRLWHCDKP